MSSNNFKKNSTIILSVEDVKKSLQKFGLFDYSVFLFMLMGCSLIGIYFAWKMQKNKSKKNCKQEDDYLVGGRNMKIFPVSMSLIASFVSGITLLGTPTEIYLYGIQYMYVAFAIVVMGIVMHFIYLPVFHELKLTSTYQYLETRFDRRIRLFGSLLFVFGSMLWLPIVIYVPALAFNQATGANVHLITPIVCVVCIFYTCVGGLQAVVWTDVIQTVFMFGAMLLVIIKGTRDVGGINVVMERAFASERIESINTTFDLTERHTIYSLIIGGFPQWLKSNAVSQNMVQRYLSLPTLRNAKTALWIFVIGVIILLGICCYSGLLIFATFHDCDPLSTKLAKAKDQLLPLLVMQTLSDYPGLPGLFVAGVFSAALSSLSTGLNSMSAVVLEDLVKSFTKKPLGDKQTAFIMRAVVVIVGAICVGLVFVVERLGTVLQLSMSLGAVTNGPLLGIFTMAVAIPWVEGRGAIIGGSTSLVFMGWLCTKAQSAIRSGELFFETKPLNTDGCQYEFSDVKNIMHLNSTLEIENNIEGFSFNIYHISYLFYTLLGCLISVVIAVIASLILGPNKPSEVDPSLLAPIIRKFIKYPDKENKNKFSETKI